MKVINFLGGPGSGKSTAAAGLFYQMKVRGFSAELVTEYAKDVTWERRHTLLSDQLYLFAKQNRRLARLLGHPVDFAITDSPLFLGIAYAQLVGAQPANLTPLILEMYRSYDNINIVLQRNASTYSEVGRTQTLEEATSIDQLVLEMMEAYNIPYTTIVVGDDTDWMDELIQRVTA